MAGVKILTKQVREEDTCKIEITGKGPVDVTISISGKIVKKITVKAPAILSVTLPPDSGGYTLRVSVPGDFDTAFILAR